MNVLCWNWNWLTWTHTGELKKKSWKTLNKVKCDVSHALFRYHKSPHYSHWLLRVWEKKGTAVIKDLVPPTAVHYHIFIYTSGCAVECYAAHVTSHRQTVQFFLQFLDLHYKCIFELYCTARTWPVHHISNFLQFGTWHHFPNNTTAQFLYWICLCVFRGLAWLNRNK